MNLFKKKKNVDDGRYSCMYTFSFASRTYYCIAGTCLTNQHAYKIIGQASKQETKRGTPAPQSANNKWLFSAHPVQRERSGFRIYGATIQAGVDIEWDDKKNRKNENIFYCHPPP